MSLKVVAGLTAENTAFWFVRRDVSLPVYKGGRKPISLTLISGLLEGQEKGKKKKEKKRKAKHTSTSDTKHLGRAEEWCKHRKQLKAKSNASLGVAKRSGPDFAPFCEGFDYF